MGRCFGSETGTGWFLKSGENEGEHEITHAGVTQEVTAPVPASHGPVALVTKCHQQLDFRALISGSQLPGTADWALLLPRAVLPLPVPQDRILSVFPRLCCSQTPARSTNIHLSCPWWPRTSPGGSWLLSTPGHTRNKQLLWF